MDDHRLEPPAITARTGWFGRATGPRRGARPRRIGRARTSALNLALQGGGAHGAFTWGVLDRLLEDRRFCYEGISGTSAGAINAVVFASGWLGAAPRAPRRASPRSGIAWRSSRARCTAPGSGIAALNATAQLLSPYQLNPLAINPLRDLLESLVDFERLRRDRTLKLLIAATQLRTGSLRIFESRELSADAVLASACLPWLHQAVEIDGEAYWDGGYVSNPPLVPLVERCRARDLLLVRINSSARTALPKSAGEIRNRVGEIVFDQPLEHELALLAARRGALAALTPAQRRLARHRLHMIDGRDPLSALDPMTKIVPDRSTLERMRDLGRGAAADWLSAAPASALRDPKAGGRGAVASLSKNLAKLRQADLRHGMIQSRSPAPAASRSPYPRRPGARSFRPQRVLWDGRRIDKALVRRTEAREGGKPGTTA